MSIFTLLVIVLLLEWLLGFGVFHVAGALIHILLVLGGYCAGHSLCSRLAGHSLTFSSILVAGTLRGAGSLQADGLNKRAFDCD